MSSTKQPTRFLVKVFDSVSSLPFTVEENNNDVATTPTNPLEASLFECPSAFARDFSALFHDVETFRQKVPFSLLLVSFSTSNDMSGWNEDVAEERDLLQRYFLQLGLSICSRLVEAGWWADVVDPVSGKPHLGSYSNDNLFEIDPRLRPFGIQIEDLGCCKCVRHSKYGSKSLVGCIFTNAGFEDPTWKELFGQS